ncbi:MAG: C25 family cysteine peptidase [Candidatus Thermoplasmatota archaeon]
MKKILMIVIIALLLISGINNAAIKNESSKLKIEHISFSDEIQIKGEEVVEIELEGTNSILKRSNKPQLPTYIQEYTFPADTKITKIKCQPLNIKEKKITEKIRHTPRPQPINNTEKTKIKTYEKTYPDKWYEYQIGKGIKNKQKCIILKLQLFPIKYHPKEQKIQIATDFKIKIKHEEKKPDFQTQNTDYDLLIITPSQFKEKLKPLVQHKIKNKNISTKMVTSSEIYEGKLFSVNGRDKPEQIKYFIKKAYDQWDTKYVLLIGGSEQMPTRETHVHIGYHDDNEIFVSDLYYADIYDENNTFQTWDTNNNSLFAEYNWTAAGSTDKLDLYPDVYLGRLACTDSQQVESVVDKIIDYEKLKAYEKDWFRNIVLIGGDSFTPKHGDESGINEGELANQNVLDIMDDFIGTKLWVSNAKLAGFNPTGVERITESINKGCGFIHFSGHGSSRVWTTYPHNGTKQVLPTPLGSYRTEHIASLENSYKLPIVVTSACSVGKFQTNDECFSWSFISNPSGGGIASFGPTGLGYACLGENISDYVIGKMVLEMFKTYKQRNATMVGEMWTGAINNYIGTNLTGTDYKTIEEWQPFCDPTLALRELKDKSDPPKTPHLEGKKEGEIKNEYRYNVTTTDPNRDDVFYLFDWGDDSYSDWIGPYESGEKVSAYHTWKEKGNYTVRVKARDETGAESNWSSLTISMPYNKIGLDQYINFEQLLEKFSFLRILLKNPPLIFS